MSDRTAHSTDTKERILNAAEPIMLEKGFNGVGLNEVLKAVGVPKGSFYHWFPSKEQFGVELLKHYAAEATTLKRRWMGKIDTLPNVVDRLVTFCEYCMSKFLENDCHQLCLIVKLSMEVSSFSEPMRQTLVQGYKEWEDIYEKAVREGQEQGTIKASLDPVHAGAVIGDIWLGASVRSVVLRSVEPMRHAVAFIKSYLAAG